MKNPCVKVLWYCEKWQVGGIQKIQMNLLKQFSPEQERFDLVVSEDDTDFFDDAIRRAGAEKIVTLKRRYRFPAVRVVANFFAMRSLIRSGDYDVVHFNVCHGVELIYLFWAWLYCVPVRIVHCRNNDIGAGGKSRAIKLLAHRICKHLFAFCSNVKLANSDLAAAWLYTRGSLERGEVRVLHNGINAEAFVYSPYAREQIRKQHGLEDALVIGHVGHFNYQKNHAFLLEIFAEVLKKQPNAVLLLVGEGAFEDVTRSQARQMGIADHVVFYGVSDEIPKLMSGMDVFVLPSRFEGFGNVLLEAQASGLPCIASDGVIPRSAAPTNLVQWVSLQESAAGWADVILHTVPPLSRADGVERIRSSGFDIRRMAQDLDAIYHGKVR